MCRTLLAALLLVIILQAYSLAQPPSPSLRSLAEARGISIGAAVWPQPLQEPIYASTLAREFNMLTPAYSLTPRFVHPSRDRYNFREGDAIVSFAQANRMKVRGHMLVWHNQPYGVPSWLATGNFRPSEIAGILREHIATVVSRYRRRITAWNVVNEALAGDGSLRDTFWLRQLGPQYIELAFRWAHETDPDARLFYNEFAAEGLGEKSDAVYRLVQELLRRGVPIHGVGLQMHLALDPHSDAVEGLYPPPPASDVAANISRLVALGLDVQITEMDVRILRPITEEKLARQAQIYHDIVLACLSVPRCNTLVLWGFTDRHSWINSCCPRYGAPLIFDESYQPKPAYQALVRALSGR